MTAMSSLISLPPFALNAGFRPARFTIEHSSVAALRLLLAPNYPRVRDHRRLIVGPIPNEPGMVSRAGRIVEEADAVEQRDLSGECGRATEHVLSRLAAVEIHLQQHRHLAAVWLGDGKCSLELQSEAALSAIRRSLRCLIDRTATDWW